jgi:hypothetical protein
MKYFQLKELVQNIYNRLRAVHSIVYIIELQCITFTVTHELSICHKRDQEVGKYQF